MFPIRKQEENDAVAVAFSISEYRVSYLGAPFILFFFWICKKRRNKCKENSRRNPCRGRLDAARKNAENPCVLNLLHDPLRKAKAKARKRNGCPCAAKAFDFLINSQAAEDAPDADIQHQNPP